MDDVNNMCTLIDASAQAIVKLLDMGYVFKGRNEGWVRADEREDVAGL